EALEHVAERVRAVQDILGRRILLENVSSYVAFRDSSLTEWEFLRGVAERADCLILLDVNNIYVSAVNHEFDPRDYLDAIPAGRRPRAARAAPRRRLHERPRAGPGGFSGSPAARGCRGRGARSRHGARPGGDAPRRLRRRLSQPARRGAREQLPGAREAPG